MVGTEIHKLSSWLYRLYWYTKHVNSPLSELEIEYLSSDLEDFAALMFELHNQLCLFLVERSAKNTLDAVKVSFSVKPGDADKDYCIVLRVELSPMDDRLGDTKIYESIDLSSYDLLVLLFGIEDVKASYGGNTAFTRLVDFSI